MGGVGPTTVLPLVNVPEATSRTHLIHQVKPTYPEDARHQCLHGDVAVQLTVAKNGTVRAVSRISGNQLLVYAAEKAVRRWMYEPYILNGVPAEFVHALRCAFLSRPIVLPVFEASIIGCSDSAFCLHVAPFQAESSGPSTRDRKCPMPPTFWDTC